MDSDDLTAADPDPAGSGGPPRDPPPEEWHDRPPGKRLSPLRATATGFGLAIAGFAVAFLLFFLVAPFVNLQTLSAVEAVLLNLVILQGIAFPTVAFGYLRVRGLPFEYLRIRWPSLRDLLVGVGGYVLAFALVFAAAVVITQLGLQTAERTDQAALSDPQVLLLLIPLALLVIGPGEELLFRGAIQSTLRESFSAPVAIVVANFAFAPAHILALTGSLQALAVSISVLFIPGLAFGYIYEYSENLVVPALAHGLYNATLFGISYVVVTSEAGAALL
jgi:hypothetical protein